jgi:hypothetical protein
LLHLVTLTMENNHRDLAPADLVKIYKKHKKDITIDEAKGVLDFMDKMIGMVKKQLWDGKTNRYRFPDDKKP